MFTYCANNMIIANSKQLNKLNVLLNKCSHKILGILSYRLNTTTILNKLNWLSYHQLIIHESIKLIHRVSFEAKPPSLANLIERSDIDRQVRKPSIQYKAISARTSNSFIHRGIFLYNLLPDNICFMSKKPLAKQ